MAISFLHLFSPSFLLVFVACLIPYVYRRVTSKRDVRSLPCPPNASLLWGHELEAFERPCGDFYTQCIDTYGPTFRIKGALGHEDILVLADPKAIAHVFHNIYNYPHSAIFRPLIERLLGRGLVWVEGEAEHKRMRRLVSPAFSPESVRAMAPVVYEVAGKLQSRMANAILSNNGGMTANILDFSSGATLDIIGKVGFNHEFEQGASLEAQKISRSWREQVGLGLKRSGFAAIAILRIFPFITSIPLKAIQAQGEIKIIIKQIASAIVQRNAEDMGDGKTILSLLMHARSKDREEMPKDELLDHICTFVLVGHETTSASICYTLWELARNPDKQKRLREEISAFPGNPTYDDLQTKLPYLDAVCKEGLRLHPPSAHMERVTENHDVIPLKFPIVRSDGSQSFSITVEKGQAIYFPSISINRLKAVWGDGEIFRPERWFEPMKGDVKIEGWSNMFTFSDGPRNCIGYRLAVFEWKVIMLTLVRHFVFHDTGAKMTSRFSSTLQPFVIGKESQGVQLPLKITLV